MTMSLRTIRCRHNDYSTESESDYCANEYVTDDCRIICNEHQHENSFFGRRDILHHKGLTVIELSDPTRDPQMNYWYHRLEGTCHARLGEKSEKLCEELKRFGATLENTTFSGEEQSW